MSCSESNSERGGTLSPELELGGKDIYLICVSAPTSCTLNLSEREGTEYSKQGVDKVACHFPSNEARSWSLSDWRRPKYHRLYSVCYRTFYSASLRGVKGTLMPASLHRPCMRCASLHKKTWYIVDDARIVPVSMKGNRHNERGEGLRPTCKERGSA